MDLRQPVILFRKGILKVKSDGYRFELLDEFPVGCCEFSSYLLAKFLIEKIGISPLKIVMGENRFKKSQRHIWLRFGEVDIDITAHQFSSTDRAVFVDTNSEWHKRFKIIDVEMPDPKLRQLNGDARFALLHDYKKILTHINDKKYDFAWKIHK